MKKLLAALLVIALLAASAAAEPAETYPFGTGIMYVYTPNSKPVHVRSTPAKENNIIGSADYGAAVLADWSYVGNDGWTRVFWEEDGCGYIMSRYLVDTEPGPAPDPNEGKEEEQLDKELESEKDADPFFYISVIPAQASGWVSFRSGPSRITSCICTYSEGKELLVEGETDNWYRVRDTAADLVGYVPKQYTQKLNKQYIKEVTLPEGVEKLGSLNINGEFDLTCKLPDGFDLQVVKARGDRIVAAVLTPDLSKPELYLSVAYEEAYADVERMNDMSDEELAVLEATFREMNDVDISYTETGHGTKLLVVRETGTDTDFVDILAIYKGYFVEFNMTPSPKAAEQKLTDEQIQMCIEFLTNVEFTPTK